MGCSVADLERLYQKPVRVLMRPDVEEHPEFLLDLAQSSDVVFLTGGDPMVSTTHADIRLRARSRGISTSLIHGASIAGAVCGISGLQNYRFGKSCSVPFPAKNWSPSTPIDVISDNIARELHTLVYLDIQISEDSTRFMTVSEGIMSLSNLSRQRGISIPLYIGIARAGSAEPFVRAGDEQTLLAIDFGSPLHILVVPATLHDMEREYLEAFAGL
jgi:diphthine synthase